MSMFWNTKRLRNAIEMGNGIQALDAFEIELLRKFQKMEGKSGSAFYRTREARQIIKEILGE